MKKYLTIIFTFIVTFIFIGRVSAKGKVEISNVSISDKTSTMVAKVDSYNELTLNTKESFYEVEEYVTYSITIKNTTGESLSVDKISDNLTNDYIETSYNYDKKEIKNNEEYSFNITLKYKKEITDNSKKFNLPINIVIDYTNGKSTNLLVNPDTKDNVLVYFIIFVLSAISLVFFKTKKKKLLVFAVIFCLIPSIAYAASKINITMNNEIGIYKRLAIMDKGINVSKKMKNLAGAAASDNGYAVDSNIRHIVRAQQLPSNANLSDNNKISSTASLIPIYAWFENETLYYYTDADKIYLSEDSSYIFNNLSKVEDIDVSMFDTSNVTSMTSMFYGCKNLKNIDVSNFDTSNVTIMYAMFYSCMSLEQLDIKNFNTSNVTNMAGMFSLCTRLKTIDVSNFDTRNVTTMFQMFSGMDNGNIMYLEEIVGLDKFDTRNVTTMSHMFYGCAKLKAIDVSHFDTSNVVDFGGMFHDCTSLESLDVSNFNTSKAKYMNHMFNVCDSNGSSGRERYSKLTYLDLTNFDTTNLERIDWLLDSLKYVNAEITIRSTKINLDDFANTGKGAFSDVALYEGSRVVINYTKDTEELVDRLVATKTPGANVFKGRLVE